MISVKPLDFYLQRKDAILANDFKVTSQPPADKYLQILNLVGLQKHRWPEELLTRSAMALVLLGILRASGYFGISKTSSSPDTYTANELFIGSLILKHLQVRKYQIHRL